MHNWQALGPLPMCVVHPAYFDSGFTLVAKPILSLGCIPISMNVIHMAEKAMKHSMLAICTAKIDFQPANKEVIKRWQEPVNKASILSLQLNLSQLACSSKLGRGLET